VPLQTQLGLLPARQASYRVSGGSPSKAYSSDSVSPQASVMLKKARRATVDTLDASCSGSCLYASVGMGGLSLGLTDYFAFYNDERPHQAPGNRTPDQVYMSGQGGGAKIVDKYGKQAEVLSGQRRPVACEAEYTA